VRLSECAKTPLAPTEYILTSAGLIRVQDERGLASSVPFSSAEKTRTEIKIVRCCDAQWDAT